MGTHAIVVQPLLIVSIWLNRLSTVPAPNVYELMCNYSGCGVEYRFTMPWHPVVVPQELEHAYNGFLDRRMVDQGYHDTISIVQFDSRSRLICQASPIGSATRTLSMNGGGTRFAGAMVSAQGVLRRDHASRPAQLVFMSDGGASDAREAAGTLSSIVSERQNIGVEVIAFGGRADMTALGLIANAGRTTVKTAGAGGLTKIFVDIATGASAASQELYEEICRRIAEEVSRQLRLEYL